MQLDNDIRQQPSGCATFDIISAAIDCEPTASFDISYLQSHFVLGRWRYFAGRYRVQAMPTPVIVLHVGGKAKAHYIKADGSQSSEYSIPGDFLAIAADTETHWAIEGEIELLILTLADKASDPSTAAEEFCQSALFDQDIKMGLNDALTSALLRQLALVLGVNDHNNEPYVTTLFSALMAQLQRFNSLGRIEHNETPDGAVGKGPSFQINQSIRSFVTIFHVT